MAAGIVGRFGFGSRVRFGIICGMGRGKNNRIALWLATLSLAFSLHTLAQSDNLELGAPGTADKVIDREGYALGYKSAWKTARWVTYRLTDDEVLNQVARRSEEFAPDPQIIGGPQLEDYRGSGYDRGHLAPAADMKWSQRAMTECFYLSNMVPQDRGNNGGIWNEIENTVRGFACAEGSVFVATGPVTPERPVLSVGKGRVAVPTELWKVVYDETPPQKMIGFIVPNRSVKGKPKDYACSVAEVERRTGLRFFPKLTGKDSLKASFDASAWDWSKSQRRRVAAAPRAAQPASTSKVSDSYFAGFREEYRAGGAMPVSSRKAAPVCDKWPDTGWWLSTNSNKRHNRKCENYRKTRGYPCRKDEGSPCGKCGG